LGFGGGQNARPTISHKNIPDNIEYLPETEENGKDGDVVLDKEHDSGADTEEPSDGKT
jgi:hypothetical protein